MFFRNFNVSQTISKNCSAIHKVENNLIFISTRIFSIACFYHLEITRLLHFDVKMFSVNFISCAWIYLKHVYCTCTCSLYIKKNRKKKHWLYCCNFVCFFLQACTTTFTVPVSASRTKAIKHGSCLQHFQICA